MTLLSTIENFFSPLTAAIDAFVSKGETDLKNAASTVKTDIANDLASAGAAVSSVESKVASVVNPVVNAGISAFGSAVSAAYPPFAALVNAAEGEVENLADEGTDAILVAAISAVANLLSEAGKATAAANFTAMVGAS